MLNLMGVNTVRLGNSITIEPVQSLRSIDYTLPGDPSSAAFLIALGLMKSKKLIIKDVLLNERRIGFLKILKRMNAKISIENLEVQNNESVGDIHVSKSNLSAIKISKEDVSDMVDEFPIFTLLATQAKGTTTVSGAGELRLKESDRIESMEIFIKTLGGEIEVNPEGFKINGPQKFKSGQIKTFEDHRIAMTGVIANLAINEGIKPDNINCISDSYPSFFSDLEKIGANYDY
jgi:3-phosphoshikimate 1-carboxyvinyltransferase